jgi:hypothetical protein
MKNDKKKQFDKMEQEKARYQTMTTSPAFKKKSVAKKMKKPKFDLVGSIMEHENGTLDKKGTQELFAHLRKTGMLRSLQGQYGRDNERMKEGTYIYNK